MSEENEGPRSFAHTLLELDGGMAHTELSVELHKLTQRLKAEAENQHKKQKGSLTLTLGLAVDPAGITEVYYEIKRKDPKPLRGRTVLWMTEGGNLSPQNPRQMAFPLREVDGGRADVRDLEDTGNGEG